MVIYGFEQIINNFNIRNHQLKTSDYEDTRSS